MLRVFKNELYSAIHNRIVCALFVVIARVYARNCSLIILDEPSSALDIISEKEMFSRIKVLSQNKCVIMISHRIENIMDADRIYVMEHGRRIVESGTHAQLVKMGGCYYDMYIQYREGHKLE